MCPELWVTGWGVSVRVCEKFKFRFRLYEWVCVCVLLRSGVVPGMSVIGSFVSTYGMLGTT